MISRAEQKPVLGKPKHAPSYDGLCDDIEGMIRDTLPDWHQTVTEVYEATEEGERKLTFHFYTFLDQTARELSVSWKFAHEDPRTGSRSEDVSIVSSSRGGIWIEQTFYAGHERFYAIEAKRLPTPQSSSKDRTREYVCGDWQRSTDPDKPLSGGIERFKENKHGEGLRRSGMVAFVQEGTCDAWLEKVNGWISDMVSKRIPSARSSWTSSDALRPGKESSASHREFLSIHSRSARNHPIRLRHFWIAFLKPE